MSESDEPRAGLTKVQGARRKAVAVTGESVVRHQPLSQGSPLPLLVEPNLDGVDLAAWAGANRELVGKLLLDHGGLLFRGFAMSSDKDLERFISALSGELLEYTYRSTPRTRVGGRIYTSTEYPAEQSIPFHNEMSYASEWPKRICFLCIETARSGGETPIADSRRVLARIPQDVQRRFRDKKVMYVRNYGRNLDLPWQQVFQTEDRAEVERFCGAASIGFEWSDGDRLKTWQICQAVTAHPDTGEEVWFNQAHLFHLSSLDPRLRDALQANFRTDELPRNSCYGDGSPIESDALDTIREAYRQEEVIFPWQQGDLLMLDNILVAHARRPYTGTRKIVVGMAELVG
jgi:alpha-ketoglutarate-dependent taurine dioxygenase